MELRVLNYFLMAAREENITKAAQLLHVTQPTLSRQLMQLEEELGVQLFRRSRHHIILTEEGMLLKRRAQELITLAEKTKKDLAQSSAQLSGEFSIGCGELQSVEFLTHLLARFQTENPLVQFNIYSGTADNIKERLENGLLDMGLLLEPVDVAKYAFLQTPQKERWGVFVHKDSPLAEKQSVAPEDLLGQPLTLPSRGLVLDILENWFGQSYDDLSVIGHHTLAYNAGAMVRGHMCAAIGLQLNCIFADTCFIPFSPALETGSVLVWKKAQRMTPIMSAFLELVNKCVLGISDDTV